MREIALVETLDQAGVVQNYLDLVVGCEEKCAHVFNIYIIGFQIVFKLLLCSSRVPSLSLVPRRSNRNPLEQSSL